MNPRTSFHLAVPSLIVAVGLWSTAQARAQQPAKGIPGTPDFLPGQNETHGMVDTPSPSQPIPRCICGQRAGWFGWRRHTAACKRHWQEHFLGYMEEFNEWPLGAALYAHERTQVANGRVGRLTFYDYDFVNDTATLNVKGRQKLARVSVELPRCFSPVLIEQTVRSPGLDEARRQSLLTELAQGPFPVPLERVIVGPPVSTGLSGREAIILFGSQMNQLTGGMGGRSGGFAASGFNGGFDSTGLSAPATTFVP